MAVKKSDECLLKILLWALSVLRESRGEGDNGKIFGGTEIIPHSYPWLVDVWMGTIGDPNEPPYRFCGGTIIHREWIMTAFHCLPRHVHVTDVLVTAGRHEAGKNDEMEQTSTGVTEVSWEPNPPYCVADIMLIRVTPPFNITKAVQVANLPPENILVQGQVTPVGWGTTETGEPSKVPLKVDVPVVDKVTCQEQWTAHDERKVIYDDELCAGGGDGKGSCHGDSGGPLHFVADGKTYVVGIVHAGHGVCNKTGIVPDLYLRVSSYIRRIHDTIPRKETCNRRILAVLGASSTAKFST